MVREYARVKVSIWADSDFRHLSDPAQALYFRLITSPTMNLAGVADWRPKRLAALTYGATAKTVTKAAAELTECGYVVIDDDTEEVLVRSFIRHDGLIKTPNIAAAMVKDYAGIASETIRQTIIYELHQLRSDEPDMKGWQVVRPLFSERSADQSNPSGNPSGMASGTAYPNPSGNRSHIPHPASRNQQPASPHDRGLDGTEFARFWDIYPKKTGKGDAAKAFDKAAQRAGVDTVLDGAQRLASDPNLPDKQFIPNPSTWLNQDRWEDEPYPERDNSRPQSYADRQTEILDRELEWARQADAADEEQRLRLVEGNPR